MKSRERVLLGMSGGTDSSVAAMRLQDADYEVTGATFRFYEVDSRMEYSGDARASATRLGIEYVICDTRELFRERIIHYLIDRYLTGHAPVPCTLRNNELKWALLTGVADERGIYRIPTGYYTRKVLLGEQCYIVPVSDGDEDQTFFSWGLKQDILQRMLLPIGDVTKEEARAYAAGRGFVRAASKRDGIGVCFCPLDYHSPPECEVPAGRLPGGGLFIGKKGEVLDGHEGYPFYTIGQQRGLGIHLDRAVFVKEARATTSEVVLVPLASLHEDEVLLKNWDLVSE